MADVRIVMTGHGFGKVIVDGREVERVRRVAFEAEPGKPNRVTLTLERETVEIEGPAEVSDG